MPTTCTDTTGDGGVTPDDVYNCAGEAGTSELTLTKTSPDACSGACEAAQCCGVCVIIICYYWLGFIPAKTLQTSLLLFLLLWLWITLNNTSHDVVRCYLLRYGFYLLFYGF